MSPTKHRLHENERQARRRAETRRLVVEEKKKGCSVCGRKNLPATELDFDHLDEATKVTTVSLMVSRGRSVDAVIREIRKCRLVCKAHHGERHSWQVRVLEASGGGGSQ